MPRPLTLNDVLKGLQRQIDRALNPTPSQATVLDVLAVSDESLATVDAKTLTPGPGSFFWGADPLTLSGYEITDAIRLAGLQGDGRAAPDSSMGIWEATTNRENTAGADVSFEAGTAGYTTGGTNTIASDATLAKFGAKSCKATYQDHVNLLYIPLTLTAGAHSAQRWIYIPADYDGAGVKLHFKEYVGATGTLFANADMALRDQWQLVRVQNVVIVAGDLVGYVVIEATGAAPTAGRFVYIDGCQTEAKAICTPFTIAPRSAARVQAPASLLDETQGWVAMRVRMGWASGAGAGNYPGIFTFMDSSAERISVFEISSTGSIGVERKSGGANPAVYKSGVSHAAGDIRTIIGAWTSTQIKISVGGSAFVVAASTAIPTLAATLFDIGRVDELLNSDVLWLACGPGTLTDADAATLYALGNTEPSYGTFTGSQDMTVIWPADTAAVTSTARWGEAEWS